MAPGSKFMDSSDGQLVRTVKDVVYKDEKDETPCWHTYLPPVNQLVNCVQEGRKEAHLVQITAAWMGRTRKAQVGQ